MNEPTLFILSGPPGAGKTTRGDSLLPAHLQGLHVFHSDEYLLDRQAFYANWLPEGTSKEADRLAREDLENHFLDLLSGSLENRCHFAYETQIRNLDQWQIMAFFQKAGFLLQMAYIGLDNPLTSAVRVQKRIEKGGHREVSPELAMECYHANLLMLNQYFSLFDELHLYDGTGTSLLTLASLKKGAVTEALAAEQQPD
ncbi:zeta toxin family protein [Paraflavisolibacter sp. H34]|uniref:zeta toxin family protein n=1 Tax=Huijunlia imazamoxiresistens TaxID=3127457 RepID=UPI0030169AB4